MRMLLFVLALSLAFPVNAQNTYNRSLVADALDWYATWMGAEPPAGAAVQTCRGELKGTSYQFRCEPLFVAVGAITDSAGYCSIVSMMAATGEDHEVRVPRADHLIPPGVPIRKGVAPRDCGELPISDGAFEFKVMPNGLRPVSDELSDRARRAALAYYARRGNDLCLLRFPKVKPGDPFVHVYVECNGALNVVWEFTVERGQVADFAHWSFTRRRGGLPPGFEWRWKSNELWFATSSPADRKASKM